MELVQQFGVFSVWRVTTFYFKMGQINAFFAEGAHTAMLLEVDEVEPADTGPVTRRYCAQTTEMSLRGGKLVVKFLGTEVPRGHLQPGGRGDSSITSRRTRVHT